MLWNKAFDIRLAYFWNWDGLSGYGNSSGWTNALDNPNVTVTYNVRITNADTNAVINDGDSVALGTRIKLNFLKHAYTDISWFGTGYSEDSPYGEWREEGMAPPKEDTCKDKDFLRKYIPPSNPYNYALSMYIPLVIDSPNKSITNLSGLTRCVTDKETEIGGMSVTCTVSSVGKINPKFNFSSTKGTFYYRYYLHKQKYEPVGCYGNNIGLRKITKMAYDQFGWAAPEVADTTFQLSVPEKTITYTLNAYQPNNPPAPPTITGPKTGYRNATYTFGFKSTDPDGDRIRYAVDWDKNGVADQYLPASGNVSSGTLLNANKIWSTLGSKTFQAATLDDKGVWSGWTSYTINI